MPIAAWSMVAKVANLAGVGRMIGATKTAPLRNQLCGLRSLAWDLPRYHAGEIEEPLAEH